LVMATKKGRVKRTSIGEFAAVRPSGLIALNLKKGDELGWVKMTKGEEEIILVTEQGYAVRFSEGDVRPMGRTAGGVMGIKLSRKDAVAAMDVVDPKADLLLVTEKGFGKRTPLRDYPLYGRHAKGVQTMDVQRLGEIGRIVDARVVSEKDEITLISAEGMVLRTTVENISGMGRATKGVVIMKLREGDTVASLARINKKGRKRKRK